MLFLQPDISIEVEQPAAKSKAALPPLHDVSGLIRLALADLEEVETDERYIVNMDRSFFSVENVYEAWLGIIPRKQRKCFVCLAGCVMVNSLGQTIDNSVEPTFNSEGRGASLITLDYLRQGAVRGGLLTLGIPWNPSLGIPSQVHITPYAKDKAAFKADMHQLADQLEAHGY